MLLLVSELGRFQSARCNDKYYKCEIFVHLVGFTIEMCYNARLYERQKRNSCLDCQYMILQFKCNRRVFKYGRTPVRHVKVARYVYFVLLKAVVWFVPKCVLKQCKSIGNDCVHGG